MEVLERMLKMKDYDNIRKDIKKLEDKRKSIDNKIFTFREERGKYKKLIDDGKDAYDEFKNINMEIDKLREKKSEINKRINILHNKLIV